MQAYQIKHGSGIEGLTFTSMPEATELSPQEVRVRIKAVSLNYRDLMVTMGIYPTETTRAIVPGSDCAGEVIETGSAVGGLKPGDRVMASFYPNWRDGEPAPEKFSRNFGVDGDGVLREEIVLLESDLVKIPDSLSFAEASTLPCAGLTAWNALFEITRLAPGSTVLLQGTGGVSIMALQLAKAAGHYVIITSSSDEKLEKCRGLGADATINYRDQPEWQDAVLEMTDQQGVDLVIDVGGTETVQRSVASARFGGTIAIIGGVSGFSGSIDPSTLLFGYKSAKGLTVGSTVMLKSLSNFIEVNGIKPVIDTEFTFDQVPEAYKYLEAGKHFGKVIVRID
ncbi:MAG: zinc-dependent alcohol dehydrogenase family protein [bacterium]